MLVEITISNFQNHSDSRLVLSPGVNVIRGESDQGKSAAVRAVSWVVLNRPQGTENLRRGMTGQDVTEVTLQTDDDALIARQRDRKHINQYEIVRGDGAPEPLKALRTDVPQEIQDVLRMNSVNVQGQHDDYFLLRQSPGEVARSLNRAVGLDTIDESLSRIGSMATSAKNTVSSESDRLADLERKLKTFDGVDDLLLLAEEAYQLEKEAEEMDAVIRQLTQIADTAAMLAIRILKYAHIDALMDTLVSAEEIEASLKEERRDVSDVAGAIAQWEIAAERFRRYESADLDAIDETLKMAESTHTDGAEMQMQCFVLGNSIESLTATETRLKACDGIIRGCAQNLSDILESEKICPTCFQVVEDVQSIITHIKERA